MCDTVNKKKLKWAFAVSAPFAELPRMKLERPAPICHGHLVSGETKGNRHAIELLDLASEL